ncbi:hypothetical protein MJO29_014635 [Puccinia striiformis f. sp. tritici]|nr:hypothetical protein MJO29_014635 [Puccinia striiformis f. sp. tritici]
MNEAQITSQINKVLDLLKPTVGGETVTVKAVLLFPSGDLKVFTKTRRMAQWLVDNKHAWTAKADSTFVTAQVSYPVLLHSCPASFDPEDEDHIVEFCDGNGLARAALDKIRWLVSPKSAGKSQGSLLAHFFDKDLATKVQSGRLAVEGMALRGQKFSPGPKQCFNCLEVGHLANACKNPTVCMKCGGKHSHSDCSVMEDSSLNRTCHRCVIKARKSSTMVDVSSPTFAHSPLSALCPIKKLELEKLSPPNNPSS